MHRTDANQAQILKALRQIPQLTVSDLSKVGGGFPDIIVGYKGREYLFEIKNPNARGKPRQNQLDFAANWKGSKVHFVWTIGEILAILDIKST